MVHPLALFTPWHLGLTGGFCNNRARVHRPSFVSRPPSPPRPLNPGRTTHRLAHHAPFGSLGRARPPADAGLAIWPIPRSETATGPPLELARPFAVEYRGASAVAAAAVTRYTAMLANKTLRRTASVRHLRHYFGGGDMHRRGFLNAPFRTHLRTAPHTCAHPHTQIPVRNLLSTRVRMLLDCLCPHRFINLRMRVADSDFFTNGVSGLFTNGVSGPRPQAHGGEQSPSSLPLPSATPLLLPKLSLVLETADDTLTNWTVNESYTLVVKDGSAVARAATPFGGLRALETFYQLVAAGASPQSLQLPHSTITIADAPAYVGLTTVFFFLFFGMYLYRSLRGCSYGSRGFLEDR